MPGGPWSSWGKGPGARDEDQGQCGGAERCKERPNCNREPRDKHLPAVSTFQRAVRLCPLADFTLRACHPFVRPFPPQVPPLAPAKDTTRLRKHVSLVLERLARGMRLVAPGEAGGVLAAAAGAAGARLYTQQESMGVQQQQQQYDGYEGANGADGVGARVMVVEGEEDGGQQGGYDGGYGGGYGGGYEEGM